MTEIPFHYPILSLPCPRRLHLLVLLASHSPAPTRHSPPSASTECWFCPFWSPWCLPPSIPIQECCCVLLLFLVGLCCCSPPCQPSSREGRQKMTRAMSTTMNGYALLSWLGKMLSWWIPRINRCNDHGRLRCSVLVSLC